jgi:hypothetical protein
LIRADNLIIKLAALIQIAILFCISQVFAQDVPSKTYTQKDTSYISIASQKIINMTIPGKAPRVTLSLNFNYDIGHLDMAGNENTVFRKAEFIAGETFGTRYGYGGSLTGKFALHKAGNARLNVTGSFQRFMSNFIISVSPEGKVHYNVFGGSLGIENNFSPNKKFKPYVGGDFVISVINGGATLQTDSTDFDLKIKNSVRFGLSFNLGFEIAVNNKFGFNFGYKLVYANLIGRKSKASTNANEIYLNDDKLLATDDYIQFAGWKQFVYSTFSVGLNYYFGMKNKK